jgi:hypothetical protein
MLHDRRVPGTRGNIDHIAIAPAGGFVIDAKFYDGVIRIRNVGNIFRRDERLYVGSRDCSKLARNMAWQVEAVSTSLSQAGIAPVPPVVPVLCFVDGDWPWFGAPDAFEGVRLESERSIAKLFDAECVLDSEAIDQVARILAAACRLSSARTALTKAPGVAVALTNDPLAGPRARTGRPHRRPRWRASGAAQD